MNEIIIRGLEVESCIGVPDLERRTPQRLRIDVVLIPGADFADLNDNISRTVDYHAASRRIVALAAERPRRLIETLACEIADMLIRDFPATCADVTVRKFILPDTEFVAVRCRRTRS